MPPSESGSPLFRYRLGNPELDDLIQSLTEKAIEVYGPLDGEGFVRQILATAVRLVRDKVDEGDVKLLNSALKELRHALFVFSPFEKIRKVAVFGSARTAPDETPWKMAHQFSEAIVKSGWMVITGAGPGIMEAAQGGAGRQRSFGVNIRLPFEQEANKTIAGDRKLVNFRYFFTRKVMFVKEAHAIALFPGGFGTHDEGFEALTLIQTGKSEILPIVYLDAPGGDYWKDWDAYVRKHLLGNGLISEEDLSLYKITDNVDEALTEIRNFYSNYHSSRYVRDVLVLRVRRAPSPEQLTTLNEKFGDILNEGKIGVSEALPGENGEMAELPRVTLHFNRKNNGRLRQLIDALNSIVPETSSPPETASPHEIRELGMSASEEESEADDR